MVTIETSWPLDVIFVGEHVVSLAGEGHVPLVEVVLEPVVLGARATDVENRLPVRWRVVRVPLQLKIVFAVRLRRLDAVRPCSTSEGPECGEDNSHSQGSGMVERDQVLLA